LKDFKYQNATVISRERAEKYIEILENPDNNELKNLNQKEICLKEDLYDRICAYHQTIGHEIEPNIEINDTLNNDDEYVNLNSELPKLSEIIVSQQINTNISYETIDLTNNNNDDKNLIHENEIENTTEEIGNDKENNCEIVPTFQKIHNTTKNLKRKVIYEVGDYVKVLVPKIDQSNTDTCYRACDIGPLESFDYPKLAKIPSA
ncbi:5170_t:CDS:2, partial [Racocetra persica]